MSFKDCLVTLPIGEDSLWMGMHKHNA